MHRGRVRATAASATSPRSTAPAPAAATSWRWPATRSSWSTTATRAVSLPEMPLLGVLPGTGGLTRLVDKRKVRRDLADVFCTVAEGVKGKRAVEWGLVDDGRPAQPVRRGRRRERARELADGVAGRGRRRASTLDAARARRSRTTASTTATSTRRRSTATARIATLTVRGPEARPAGRRRGDPRARAPTGGRSRAFRELDDALLPPARQRGPRSAWSCCETEGDVDAVAGASTRSLDRLRRRLVRRRGPRC